MFTAATVAGVGAGWALETVVAKMRRGFDGRWRVRELGWEAGNTFAAYAGQGWQQAPSELLGGPQGGAPPKA